MKKILRAAVSLILCILIAAAVIPLSAAAEEFYSTAELLQIKSHIEKDAGMGVYATVQGACTDGKYAYFAVLGNSTVILKYDMSTWKLAKKATVGGLGHANDMAYNSKEKFIVVSNNYGSDDVLTILDPSTLKVKDTVEATAVKEAKKDDSAKKASSSSSSGVLNQDDNEIDDEEEEEVLNLYSIAYNASNDTYIAGISGTYHFAVLDKDFKQIKRIKGVNTGYTRQGCDCDGQYIYFAQSGGDNVVVIYDYDGKQVDMISLGHSHEVENLFHVGKNFFLTLHYYGNSVQRMGMSESTRICFDVMYDSAGGSGTMEKTTVHYGTDTPLRKNAFTKAGYSFGGWKMHRNYDSKTMACRLGSTAAEWLDAKDVYNPSLISDGAKVAKLTRLGDVWATAFWIADYYGVYFDSDEAEGWMSPETVEYAQDYYLPANEFRKEGYVFGGYVLSRDYDGRVYGYRKGGKNPEWLESKDAEKLHYFAEGDRVSKLTYDGAVTFRATFRFAFTFDEGHENLLSYIGVDEHVHIPNEEGSLSGIAAGAIQDNTAMTELYLPATVTTVEKGALENCQSLKAIILEGEWPESFDRESVLGGSRPYVYELRDGVKLCLGFYADRQSADLIRFNATAFDRNFAAWQKEH